MIGLKCNDNNGNYVFETDSKVGEDEIHENMRKLTIAEFVAWL